MEQVETHYQVMERVNCIVVSKEPGGYAVTVDGDVVPGFVPTDQQMSPGDKVTGYFVCVHNNRLLISLKPKNAEVLEDW